MTEKQISAAEQDLQTLYEGLLRDYFPRRSYTIKVLFYNSKSIRHTIALERKLITIKIAEAMHGAPQDVLQILGLILLAKLFRYKVDIKLRRHYNDYVREHILPNRETNKRAPSAQYTPKGRYFDLEEIFARLNAHYFGGKLPKPVLGWSLKKAYVRLGFYEADKNLLVISRIFDSRKAPQEAVNYLMYHEMLHIHFPVKTVNGRRRIHGRDFREMESAFPNYEEIQKWIQKNRTRL